MKRKIFFCTILACLFCLLPSAWAAPFQDGTSFSISGRNNSDPEYGVSLDGILGTIGAKYGSDNINGSDFTSLELNYYYKLPDFPKLPILNNTTIAAGVRRLEYRDDDNVKPQIGLEGRYFLSKKTFIYDSTFWGKGFHSEEIGIGHRLTDNIELNLNYYNLEAHDLGNEYPQAEGVAAGVTFKL